MCGCGRSLIGDIAQSFIPWLEHLIDKGPVGGFAGGFGDYTPPYYYLLAVASLFAGWVDGVTLIKSVSVVSVALLCLASWRLLIASRVARPERLAVCVALLPSVATNAALMGQCDALYAAPLVMAVACAVERRHGGNAAVGGGRAGGEVPSSVRRAVLSRATDRAARAVPIVAAQPARLRCVHGPGLGRRMARTRPRDRLFPTGRLLRRSVAQCAQHLGGGPGLARGAPPRPVRHRKRGRHRRHGAICRLPIPPRPRRTGAGRRGGARPVDRGRAAAAHARALFLRRGYPGGRLCRRASDATRLDRRRAGTGGLDARASSRSSAVSPGSPASVP